MFPEGFVIYPLRNRIQGGIYLDECCYRKSEEDECLFSEALSFWDYMASVIGDGVMGMEDWCNHNDRRRPKGRSTRTKPCHIATSFTTNATENAAVTGLVACQALLFLYEPSSLPPNAYVTSHLH